MRRLGGMTDSRTVIDGAMLLPSPPDDAVRVPGPAGGTFGTVRTSFGGGLASRFRGSAKMLSVAACISWPGRGGRLNVISWLPPTVMYSRSPSVAGGDDGMVRNS